MKLNVTFTNPAGLTASRFFWAPEAEVRAALRYLASEVHGWGGCFLGAVCQKTGRRYSGAEVAELV